MISILAMVYRFVLLLQILISTKISQMQVYER